MADFIVKRRMNPLFQEVSKFAYISTKRHDAADCFLLEEGAQEQEWGLGKAHI